MAKFTGSGKFVAITANTSGYNGTYTTGMHGISFGRDQRIYCTVSSHYYETGGEVTETALSIEPGLNSSNSAVLPMCIDFPNIKILEINGKYGFTGSFKVAAGVGFKSDYTCYTRSSGTYKFVNGIMTQLG